MAGLLCRFRARRRMTDVHARRRPAKVIWVNWYGSLEKREPEKKVPTARLCIVNIFY